MRHYWLIIVLLLTGMCYPQTFEEMRSSLGGPIRAAKWYGRCVNGEKARNITYMTNPDGKGYHSARYTFAHRHGNCSDAAEFFYEILGYHGYRLILMEAWTNKNGHAACVIVWNGKYDYITNYGYNPIQASSLKEVAETLYPGGRLIGYKELKRNF